LGLEQKAAYIMEAKEGGNSKDPNSRSNNQYLVNGCTRVKEFQVVFFIYHVNILNIFKE
jgi:hypothetical protein